MEIKGRREMRSRGVTTGQKSLDVTNDLPLFQNHPIRDYQKCGGLPSNLTPARQSRLNICRSFQPVRNPRDGAQHAGSLEHLWRQPPSPSAASLPSCNSQQSEAPPQPHLRRRPDALPHCRRHLETHAALQLAAAEPGGAHVLERQVSPLNLSVLSL